MLIDKDIGVRQLTYNVKSEQERVKYVQNKQIKRKAGHFGFTKEVLYMSFLVLKEKKQNKVRSD